MFVATIILNGSTGGLGSAIVRKLRQNNIGELICIFRNKEKFLKLFPENRGIYPYQIVEFEDYTRLEQICDIFRSKEIILILTAFSISPLKWVGEYTLTEINQMIDGNLKQNVILINEIVQICRNRKSGLRIINLDSGASNFPLKGWGNYCASKAYMNSFLNVIRLENPEYKIVSFDPGVVDTNMQREIRMTEKRVFDQVEKFITYYEQNQLNSPDKVADEIIKRYVVNWCAYEFSEKYKI